MYTMHETLPLQMHTTQANLHRLFLTWRALRSALVFGPVSLTGFLGKDVVSSAGAGTVDTAPESDCC